MNSFELNKIFGAILGTLVIVMGVGFIAEEIYAPIEERGSTFELPEPEPVGADGAVEIAMIAPISIRMQDASAEAGQDIIVRCQSCHDYSPANENRVGPGLHGIVNKPIASHADFNYSDALVALAAEEEVWSYEHLDAFIEAPQQHAPGTTMSFPGLPSPEDRANLIAFLREQAEDVQPLPEPTAEELASMEAGAAPAEGETEAPAAGPDYVTLISEADVELGASIAPRCQGCHDISEANTNRVGPGLWDLVDRPIASHEGYTYSAALQARGEAGEVWDFAHLDGFLLNPQEHSPGTTMGFAGIANDEERIALIAWLREQSNDPVALEGAAPAEDAAPAAEEPAEAEAALAEEEAVAAEETAPAVEEDTAAPAEDIEAPSAEEAPVSEEPVVEVEAPETDPAPPVVTDVPGAGQEAGAINTSPVTGDTEAQPADAPEDASEVEPVAPETEAAADAPAAAGNAAADEETAAADDVAATDETEEPAAAAEAGAEGSGFITEAQVATGQTAYEANCSTCHGQDIIQSIAGYPNAGLFFNYISTAMPASAPGSLPRQQYADIVAYLLNQNGHPIGTEVLPPDQAVLGEIDPDAFAD